MKQDAHATILDLDADTAFFAVFDGHGGKEVATYAAKRLHETLKETESYVAGDVARGLEESFLALDRKMLAKEAARGKVAVLFGNERTGLTNEELAQAHACVAIPTAGQGTLCRRVRRQTWPPPP